jgi:hypothetical protein
LNWPFFFLLLLSFIYFPISQGNSTLIELGLIYLYDSALFSRVTVVAVDAAAAASAGAEPANMGRNCVNTTSVEAEAKKKEGSRVVS